MKKIFFSIVVIACLAMMLSACGSKAEKNLLGEYEVTTGADGKVGLAKDGIRVLEPVYDKVAMDNNLGVVVATKGATSVLVSGMMPVIEAEVTKMEPASTKGYTFLSAKDGVYLLKNASSTYWGPFENIVMKDNFLFFKSNDQWGAATVDHVAIAARKYDKVYIARNSAKFRVLVKNQDGWTMYDSAGATEDGVSYDVSSAQIAKLLKNYDTSAPCGIIDVDWDMSD